MTDIFGCRVRILRTTADLSPVGGKSGIAPDGMSTSRSGFADRSSSKVLVGPLRNHISRGFIGFYKIDRGIGHVGDKRLRRLIQSVSDDPQVTIEVIRDAGKAAYAQTVYVAVRIGSNDDVPWPPSDLLARADPGALPGVSTRPRL